MRQYQVPQFITVEDRIVGPLTLKQFLYLVGGAAALIVAYFSLVFVLFIIIGVPFAAFFIAMAFVKINERPFPTIIMAGLNYILRPRLYVWRHESAGARSVPIVKPGKQATPELAIPAITESKLSDLAWSLDILKEGVPRETQH